MAVSHSIFGRAPKLSLPIAVAGDGIYLIDSEGNRYLDACGGAAVSCLGHTPKKVIDRACQQLQTMAFAHTGFFTSEPAEQLADVLVNSRWNRSRLFRQWWKRSYGSSTEACAAVFPRNWRT